MDKEKVLGAMHHIDPALVEEADSAAVVGKGRGWNKSGLIAACLCLVLAGTAVAAAGASRLRVTGYFDNERVFERSGDETPYSGFEIAGGVDIIPADRISEKANQLAQENVGKDVLQRFGSWELMESFIGMDLMNNPVLEEARAWRMGPLPCELWLFSNDLGLTSLNISSHYSLHGTLKRHEWAGWILEDTVEIGLSTEILTEHFVETKLRLGRTEDEIDEFSGLRGLYPAGTEFTQEEYVTPGGLEAIIFQITQPERIGFEFNYKKMEYEYFQIEPTTYSAFFTLNGIRFSVDASHDTDAALALETLKEVLDGFEITPE